MGPGGGRTSGASAEFTDRLAAPAAFVVTGVFDRAPGGRSGRLLRWRMAPGDAVLRAVVVAILAGARELRLPRTALVTVAGLAALCAWTAASWLWSDDRTATIHDAHLVLVYVAGGCGARAARKRRARRRGGGRGGRSGDRGRQLQHGVAPVSAHLRHVQHRRRLRPPVSADRVLERPRRLQRDGHHPRSGIRRPRRHTGTDAGGGRPDPALDDALPHLQPRRPGGAGRRAGGPGGARPQPRAAHRRRRGGVDRRCRGAARGARARGAHEVQPRARRADRPGRADGGQDDLAHPARDGRCRTSGWARGPVHGVALRPHPRGRRAWCWRPARPSPSG